MLYISPFDLVKNEWNSNHVDRDNFEKLKQSVDQLGVFKPIIVRELDDGKLQILGGFHRNEAAKELGLEKVPYWNLGTVNDKTAREIALIDNTRYGVDDEERLQALLDEIGDLSILESIMPDEAVILPELEEPDTELEETDKEETEDTHKVLKFKFEVEKAEEIETFLAKIAYDNDYRYSDGYSDLAQALYHHIVLEKK